MLTHSIGDTLNGRDSDDDLPGKLVYRREHAPTAVSIHPRFHAPNT
jgi:hypothetical protein